MFACFRDVSVVLGFGASLAMTLGCSSMKADAPAPPAPDESTAETTPYRVVGYLPTYRSLDPSRLDWSALTHLCIAFANPTGDAAQSDFEPNARPHIAPLVKAAHEQNVKVLASIAGGTKEQGDLVGAQITPERVDSYIDGLLDLVQRYELDGIDVDIEGEAIGATYEPFVRKLRSALRPPHLLTAAVATKHGDPVPVAALSLYDFVNLMAYDHCSWTDEPCVQASVEEAQNDLDYWTNVKEVPRSNLVLGVPFYGWCWGCSESQTARTYAQVLRQYPEARESDWIVDGDVTISLNSEATIRKKTRLGDAYGGIMIWELGQDASGGDSLLRAIADERRNAE
jgi:chitinase